MAQEKELCIQEMARRICERRKQLRLTQEELAEMSDMTTQAVSYAESGKRAMRPDSLRKLAAALVSVPTIFSQVILWIRFADFG